MLSRKLVSVLAVSTLLMTACSSEEKKSKGATDNPDRLVPVQLTFEKPTPGAPLTREQLLEVKAMFAKKSTLSLPPGHLLFPDKNISKEQLEREEKKLAQEDPRSYAVLLDVRKNCQAVQTEPNWHTSFPYSPGQPVNWDQLKEGDYAEGGNSVSLGGSGCPAAFSNQQSARINLEYKDPNKKGAALSARANQKFQLSILKPEYAQQLNSRGLLIDNEISGVFLVREVNGAGVAKTHAKFQVGGSYYTLTQEIPYKASVEGLLVSHSKEGMRTELILRTGLKFSNFDMDVAVYRVEIARAGALENEKRVLREEIYLNGHLKSRSELEKLVGSVSQNLTALTPETSKLVSF